MFPCSSPLPVPLMLPSTLPGEAVPINGQLSAVAAQEEEDPAETESPGVLRTACDSSFGAERGLSGVLWLDGRIGGYGAARPFCDGPFQAASALALTSRILRNSALFFRSASMVLSWFSMVLSLFSMDLFSSSIFLCIACSPHFLSSMSMKSLMSPMFIFLRSLR